MSAPLSKADQAVTHLLNAIRDDGRKAYLLGRGTQSFNLLTEAHCERTGEDLAAFREAFWTQCSPERVKVVEG